MGSSSQAPSSLARFPFGEPSQLFYDDYEPLECASTSTAPWSRKTRSGSTALRPHGLSSSSPSTYARPSASSSLAPPPPGSLPARAMRSRRELSPAGSEIDDIDHDGDARLRLSPLSLYRGLQLPLNALFDEFHPSMADGEKLYRHHRIQHQGTEDAAQTRAFESAPDDDDTTTSPEQRPYSAFLDDLGCRWSTSPESVDTDLDDDCSVLSLTFSSSMSSSSLSPPFPDSSELSRVDEEDEDDADEDLAISTLELSPPLSTATPTSRDWEHHDEHQEYETRYHLIEEYPPQLYNIPPDCHSPPTPSEFSSLTSHVLHLPPLGDNAPTTDSLPLDPLRPPSPLNFSPCHRTEDEPAETAHPQRACGGELPSLLSPLDRPPSPSPPTSVSSSLARPASAILSPAVPPLSSPDPQGVRLTDEPGLDDLGLGFLSPAVSTVELPPLFSSSSPFYDFGDGPAPESPSRRRSTDLPLLEEDNSDGGFSPFSSVFSSPASEYSDLGSFRHPDGHQRSHFLSLPGSDTDDDLIPPELASKNYVPDPTITVPTTSSFSRSPSEKSARSLLMWDEDGSIEYPVEGFGFRRSNCGYPPRSPSPDLLDLDPKKIEELGGGEEGRRVWEARQRAARDETLAGLGVGYGNWSSGEREGVDRRSLGRERRRELSALLRLKLGLLEDKDQADKPKTDNSDGGAPPPTPSPAAAALAPVIASSSEPEVTLQTSTSSGSPKATPSSPSTTSSTPSASPPARHSPSTKPRITSMAQLVANMVFHRQQHPHSTLGHVHDPARPKKSSPPTRSRTWASGDLLPGGHDQPEIAGVDAPGLLEPSTPARSQTLSTSKTPTSPLRHMTLPEDLTSDDSSDDEGSGNAGGEAHSNKTPTSTTLSPLFLCASPLSYSAAELEA